MVAQLILAGCSPKLNKALRRFIRCGRFICNVSIVALPVRVRPILYKKSSLQPNDVSSFAYEDCKVEQVFLFMSH